MTFQILKDFLDYLKESPESARIAAFTVIRKLYCVRCGKKIPTEECNCWKH